MTNTTPSHAPYPYAGSQAAPSHAVTKLNTLAIVGFVLAFVMSIAGLVVSIIALSQIRKTGERGRGLAIAGIVLNTLSILLGIVTFLVLLAATISSTTGGY